MLSATLLQSKLAPYSTYAVGGWVPRGTVPEALYWDTGDPYDYLRVDRRHDHDYVIFGGNDHKTGQVDDTVGCFERLEQRLKRLLPEIAVTHRWSGQVIETNDGLPYIGEEVRTPVHRHRILRERHDVWDAVSDDVRRSRGWASGIRGPTCSTPARTKFKGGAWDYLRENKDYPYYLIRDRFAGGYGHSVRAIKRGHGDVIEVDGQPAAVYRGLDGQIHARSAVCTHMGCYVHWNEAERTWDCPCHGSRFKVNGEVQAGPAEEALAPITIGEKGGARSRD